MIPSAPHGFCGRKKELARLTSLFSEKKVSLVSGIAGMGKTALVLTFANSLKKNATYGEKLIWVACRSGWTWADLQASILQKIIQLTGKKQYLSQTGYTPEKIVEILEDNALILCIDDFQLVENENSLQLIEYSLKLFQRAKLIIASRNRVSLDLDRRSDTNEILLDGLEIEESFSMLEQMLNLHGIEMSSDQKHRITQEFKGHPFSLKLFASLLVEGGHNVEELLRQSGEFREKQGQYLLDLLWETLEPAEQDLLKTLSVLRIPVNTVELPSLSGRRHRNAQKRLTDKFLLETARNGVYVHDLIREYARSQLSPTQLAQIHKDVGHYLARAGNDKVPELCESYYHFHRAGELRMAAEVMTRVSDKRLTLGDMTESVYQLLEDALKFCGTHYRQELLQSKAGFLIYWHRYQEALKVVDQLEHSGVAALQRAKIYFNQSKYPEAVEYYNETLRIGHPEGRRLDAFIDLAMCHVQLGDMGKAEECMLQAKLELEKGVDDQLEANFHVRYGLLHYYKEDYPGVLEEFSLAEEIYRRHNILGSLALLLQNKGNAHIQMADFTKADDCFSESLILNRKTGNPHGMVYNYAGKGLIYNHLREFKKAIRIVSKALVLIERNNWVFERSFLNEITGEAYLGLLEYEKSEEHLKVALEVLEKFNNPERKNMLLLIYSQLKLFQGRWKEAGKLLAQVEEYCGSQHQDILIKVLFLKIRVLEFVGNQDLISESTARYEKLLAEQPERRKNKIEEGFNWFLDNFSTPEKKEFILHTRLVKHKEIGRTELKRIREKKEQYEIYIDYSGEELLLSGKRVNFFGKQTQVPLLYEFVVKPGRLVQPVALFRKLWGRKYDFDKDRSTLTAIITRLRKSLGDNKLERFIRSSNDPACYYFNSHTDFCVILPIIAGNTDESAG